LDEARWGLDWLLKMHPRPDWMFNQIADDRDHRGWRLPTEDTTSYGRGRERPVYFCSGEAQGLMAYKNRSTGVASTAGKFASAFALGAEIFETLDPDYADLLRKRALSAWRFGLKKPGVCQTAPCRAPYFYEEDNWVDDVELAAAELYALTKNPMHLEYGRSSSISEPITPWMGADTARHYQWYPFMNIGHFELARIAPAGLSDSLIAFYREGIERVWQRGKDNPFLMGVPFIWCSNNLVTALATQCYLYRSLTGDDRYLSLEAAMRDWLFGCNPWGVSMVINLPQNGVTAHDPHSAFSNLYNYPVDGGLLDGPVYGSIYNKLKYVHLKDPDEFAAFQSELVVYHDDVGDYATNEPTMDGTATLITYLAAIQQSVQQRKAATNSAFTYAHGGIIRGDQSKREITLVFTGDEHADGSEPIRQVLARAGIKAAFFFTGNFYRNPEFADLVRGLRADGHYLGAHSDKHLLYCDWQKRDNLLVTHEQFEADLKQNYVEMARFGITRQDAPFFLPPYEWCNRTISEWCRDMELTLINFTPGTRSNADYTTPDMGGRYISSAEILKSILEYEQRHANGLNGFILLSHIGTHPSRTDKFYLKLGELIDELRARGYGFRRVDEMLDSASSAWRLADA
ncbi:glycoside hydrolase family 9 protein, partial [candidate division KSB1 bacterium]|nr:glycoside hydrolase family 9 protein [candidate division KSB1 bacterium]